MRILGNNSHQWSFSKQSGFKSWKYRPESTKPSWSKKGWYNKPHKLRFNSHNFHTENWFSQNATNQPKSTVEPGYMRPRGRTGPPAVTLTKELNLMNPHQWFFSKQMVSKVENTDPKVPKQTETKRDGVIWLRTKAISNLFFIFLWIYAKLCNQSPAILCNV